MMTEHPLQPTVSTVGPEEAGRFNRLAATWWNRAGPMWPLHVINELRLGHVLEQIARRFGRATFNVLLLLEVVEHVDDVQAFVSDAAAHLARGGLLLASTINRTQRSDLAAIVGAERVFRVLPWGTHRWAQFVRPEELEPAAAACGLNPVEYRGMAHLPAVHRAWWTRDLSVNYIASFGRATP